MEAQALKRDVSPGPSENLGETERTDKEKKDKSTREARLTREKSKARTKTPGVM